MNVQMNVQNKILANCIVLLPVSGPSILLIIGIKLGNFSLGIYSARGVRNLITPPPPPSGNCGVNLNILNGRGWCVADHFKSFDVQIKMAKIKGNSV